MRQIPSERSPVKVLLLCLLTCGLYYPYWLFRTSEEMDGFLGESDLPPIVHLVLFVLTGTLWGFVWDVLTARKLMRMQQLVGLPITDNTILYCACDLFGAGPLYGLGIVVPLLEQTSMNEVYRAAPQSRIVSPSNRI